MATKTSAKPVFGPLIPRSMFKTRWMAKLLPVTITHQGPLPIDTETPSEIINWASNVADATTHILQIQTLCEYEAKALGLTTYLSGNMSKDDYSGLQVCLEDWWKGMLSYVKNIRKAKNGVLIKGVLPWQGLPLELRRRINALMEEIEDAKEQGGWVVDA